MHWATKKKKEPMLEGTPGSSTLYGDAVPGTSTGASYKGTAMLSLRVLASRASRCLFGHPNP